MKKLNVAVLGATGAVGELMLSLLAEREFPIEKVYPLASSRSTDKTVLFGTKALEVIDVDTFDFSKADIALFSAGGQASEQYAPIAAEKGCIVIDNTSFFRYDNDIPLIIPEVNPEDLSQYKHRNIIANPNCSTIQMLVALKPIHDAVGIDRVNVATYQSVSGAGKKGINELAQQTAALLNGRPAEVNVFSQQIAFNAIPQIDTFQENGYTREEMKMVWETQKILNDPSIRVNPTAVRVPIFYGHAEAVHLETKKPITIQALKEIYQKMPGLTLVDDEEEPFPTQFTHAADSDEVFVGRLRKDISHENGINLWIVSDNLRKGAALNSVQIAELLLKDYI